MNKRKAKSDVSLRVYSSSEAVAFAELGLLQLDIAASIQTIKVWSGPFQGFSKDDAAAVRTSLFRDAVVQFIACFDGSAEHRLVPEEVFPGARATKYYQWLRNLRNAYAAHRFGALRRAVVGIGCLPEGVFALATLAQVYPGPDRTEAVRLQRFMQRAADHVASRLANLQESLADTVADMSEAEILSLPIVKFPRSVPRSDIKTPRSRFLASLRSNSKKIRIMGIRVQMTAP